MVHPVVEGKGGDEEKSSSGRGVGIVGLRDNRVNGSLVGTLIVKRSRRRAERSGCVLTPRLGAHQRGSATRPYFCKMPDGRPPQPEGKNNVEGITLPAVSWIQCKPLHERRSTRECCNDENGEQALPQMVLESVQRHEVDHVQNQTSNVSRQGEYRTGLLPKVPPRATVKEESHHPHCAKEEQARDPEIAHIGGVIQVLHHASGKKHSPWNTEQLDRQSHEARHEET